MLIPIPIMATSKRSADINRLEVVETHDTTYEEVKNNDLKHVNTLGSIRLRHADTNELVLVPQPSSDPNDPLNWQVIRASNDTNLLISC